MRRGVNSLAKGMVVGLSRRGVLRVPDCGDAQRAGGHYWLEIMIPGSIVGLIVGYATQSWKAGLTTGSTGNTGDR
jgi:hypothetical protein